MSVNIKILEKLQLLLNWLLPFNDCNVGLYYHSLFLKDLDFSAISYIICFLSLVFQVMSFTFHI